MVVAGASELVHAGQALVRDGVEFANDTDVKEERDVVVIGIYVGLIFSSSCVAE